MNKIILIIQREFLNRVQKKSFLIATIVIPLIFPSIIGLLVYISKEQEKNAKKEVIHYVDESNSFTPDTARYVFKKFNGSLEDAKTAYQNSEDFGLLYIPQYDINNPVTITLYSKINPSIDVVGNIESVFERRIKDLKMQRLNIDQKLLDSLNTKVSVNTINVSDKNQEKSSNSLIMSGIGMVTGILMYMFIMIYGAQIMQGVIEEKMSKVVEVIISSVKPFQLMMGKIIGLASVGLLQFTIWIVLMSTLTFGILGYFGMNSPQQQAMEQIAPQAAAQKEAATSEITKSLNEFQALPLTYILVIFLFYFLGGYLLYGSLFAAVGSAVDSPAEAQQFMFPITIPLLISYLSLFMFILKEPHSTVSIWLSLIPFTSPIAMMGRLAFDVPTWQLALSMIFLIGGFVLTTWIAGRIYRVGILMHGTKVNYKVLAKWFMMKN
ncbi:MAG TPA: ABC transporter permease [Cyclobacteriaceae bacterium]|jgi:ABC-2 type transport system permease protein|nr:ABC transporter permease [Cyclobacteriaceae bacterium]